MGARAEMCELSELSELSMLLHPILHFLSPPLGCTETSLPRVPPALAETPICGGFSKFQIKMRQKRDKR
jgi:hypothetical protein